MKHIIGTKTIKSFRPADTNDDIGWFGDVGLGTGCAYKLTNHWDCDADHLDPFPALVFGLSLDYFGQKLSRNEDPFDNRHMSQAEGEQILVGFESTILTTSVCFLIDEIDRQDAKARKER